MFLNHAKCDLIKFTWGILSWEGGILSGGFCPRGTSRRIIREKELLEIESISKKIRNRKGTLCPPNKQIFELFQKQNTSSHQFW